MQKCLNLKSRVTFKRWLGFFIEGKDKAIFHLASGRGKLYRNCKYMEKA